MTKLEEKLKVIKKILEVRPDADVDIWFHDTKECRTEPEAKIIAEVFAEIFEGSISSSDNIVDVARLDLEVYVMSNG